MTSAPIPWKHVRNVLVLFAPLWVGATILFGVIGAGYAVFSSEKWSARQPLVVRDEANSSLKRLGRFASQEEMKAAQETVLELTQNPEVVAAALRQIGPPEGEHDPEWPSTKLIDAVAGKCVNIRAPKGSDFGSTEVVYLHVTSSSKERATAFCGAMFDNLTEHLRNVRRVRADSIISELNHTCDLAQRNLEEASARMRAIEVQFGTDLGELRSLNDTISGDGTNRRALEETTRDLQTAQLELERIESLYELLVASADDPQQLLINGGDLLTLQPSLERLKNGLIDAQLATSQLAGAYTEDNPKLRAAMASEHEILSRMQQETAAVIGAMQPTLRLERDRVARLENKQLSLRKRLDDLAQARTNYAKIDAEVKHRTDLLEDTQRALSEAQATRSAALSTNLVAELGPPQVIDNPIGPSGTLVTLGSTMAGLIFGLGAVFLIAPGPSEGSFGRRWTDYLRGRGRRASDLGDNNRRRSDTDDAKRDVENSDQRM